MSNSVKLNSGIFLHDNCDFIKKYPEFTNEITPDFSHVLFIPENLVIQEIIFLQDILCEFNIKNLYIIIEKNSHVSLLFLQEDIGEKIESKNILSFNLQESSKLEFFMCLAGECETEFNLSVSLLGEHAQANVNGFYLAGKKQKLSLQTVQRHLVRNTFSNLTINGVLAEGSQVKYCGNIFVDKDAVQVKACQENKNIILGQNVSLEACPELEILNSNVECKHGCAAGQFDEKQMFYLQSRGFDKNQATQLLIDGFFGFINSLDCDIKIRECLLEKIKVRVKGVQ